MDGVVVELSEHRGQVRPGRLDGPSIMALIFAGLVLLYAACNAVAVVMAGEVILRVQNGGGELALANLPAGVALVWPYQLSVPGALAPLGSVVLLKLAEALIPLLWGGVLLGIGLLLREASHVDTIFDGGVARRVATVRWLLVVLAVVPHGLRVLGSNWALGGLGTGFSTSTRLGDMFIPLFGFYLCLAFEFVLRRGEALQGELDEVI